MQPPHLEREPLFLPSDDPEAEGLLRVGPREDEVVDLLHHLARTLSPSSLFQSAVLLLSDRRTE